MNQFSVLLMSFCMALLMGCSSDSPLSINTPKKLETENSSYVYFKAKYRDQAMYLPEGWEIKEHYKTGTVYAVAAYDTAAPQKYRASLHATPRKAQVKYDPKLEKMMPQPIDLDKFSKEHLRNMERDLPGYKFVAQEVKEVNDKKVIVLNYQYDYENPRIANQLQVLLYLVEHKDEIYLITCTTPAVDFDKNSPVFEDVITNWKFL